MEPTKVKRPMGFAAMSPAKAREISKLGGQKAHEAGTAHEWTPEEAREAGRKSGAARRVKSAEKPGVP